MDVLDLVIVLVWSCSNLNTSDKNVSKSSCFPFTLDGCNESIEVDGILNIKTCVPLTVLVGEGDAGGCGRHGNFESEVAGKSDRKNWIMNVGRKLVSDGLG